MEFKIDLTSTRDDIDDISIYYFKDIDNREINCLEQADVLAKLIKKLNYQHPYTIRDFIENIRDKGYQTPRLVAENILQILNVWVETKDPSRLNNLGKQIDFELNRVWYACDNDEDINIQLLKEIKIDSKVLNMSIVETVAIVYTYVGYKYAGMLLAAANY